MTVLALFAKCRAIKIGRFILGSCNSRFTTASRVIVALEEEEKLAEIQHFLKCAIRYSNQHHSENFWLAAVKVYFEHQCRVWFGHPTEIWASCTRPELIYIPLSYIKCRVAYTTLEQYFGRIIGTDKVSVVIPLQ